MIAESKRRSAIVYFPSEDAILHIEDRLFYTFIDDGSIFGSVAHCPFNRAMKILKKNGAIVLELEDS